MKESKLVMSLSLMASILAASMLITDFSETTVEEPDASMTYCSPVYSDIDELEYAESVGPNATICYDQDVLDANLPPGENFSEPTLADDVEIAETDDVEIAETDDVEIAETDDAEIAETDDVEELGGKELPKFGVVMFSATWCAACPQAKTNIVDPLRKSGWNVVEIDVDAYPDDAKECDISNLPTFIAIKNGCLVKTERYTGNMLGPVLAWFGKKPIPRSTKKSVRDAIRSYRGQMWGVQGMTVKYHLTHDHGFTQDQLSGLSDRELHILHSYVHENGVTGRDLARIREASMSCEAPLPYIRIQQSSSGCPNGNCPISRNQYRLFRRR